jgi:hypothetical protein
MAISFIQCHSCSKKFRNKKLSKPYLGMYKGDPVFHHCWICPCGYPHTFRYYNVHINPYFNKMVCAEFAMALVRKNDETYEGLLKQYDETEQELEMAIEKMKRELIPIRKI